MPKNLNASQSTSLAEFLDKSLTSFHALKNAQILLEEQGFRKLRLEDIRSLKSGDKFYTPYMNALFAFSVGEKGFFQIAQSHTDSPALKIKGIKTLDSDMIRLDCERYGGAIDYTFFDRPLKIAGRVILEKENGFVGKTVESPYFITIPSMPAHLSDCALGAKFTVQNDLCPVLSLTQSAFLEGLTVSEKGGAGLKIKAAQVKEFDLFCVPAQTAYYAGSDNSLFCSPRLDDLSGAYCSLISLIGAAPQGIAVCALLDSEETGSMTLSGAKSAYFSRLLEKVYCARGFGAQNFLSALNDSLALSVDNAHAKHPAHPEKYDPASPAVLGGGLTIKHHVNYATDALSSFLVKEICKRADVKFQDYFHHSDLRCGSTLGLMSSQTILVKTCDVGLPQLAMHSACETCAVSDIEQLTKGICAFYGCQTRLDGDEIFIG